MLNILPDGPGCAFVSDYKLQRARRVEGESEEEFIRRCVAGSGVPMTPLACDFMPDFEYQADRRDDMMGVIVTWYPKSTKTD